MELVKKSKTHKVFKRRDGRFAVTTLKGQPVNGEEKIAVLIELKLVKKPKAKPAPVEEAPAEEAPAAEAEVAAEEAPAEAPAAEEAPAEATAEEETKE